MEFVSRSQESDDDDDDAVSEEEEKKPAKTATKKRKAASSDGDQSDDSDASYKKKKRAVAKKPKKTSDGKAKAKGKGNGFTRPYKLSADLAAVVGADELPRHEVVKKVWAIIKSRNLYDPKNKQFAICDAELQKVMGVKRFRTFGMLKYLKHHFIED